MRQSFSSELSPARARRSNSSRSASQVTSPAACSSRRSSGTPLGSTRVRHQGGAAPLAQPVQMQRARAPEDFHAKCVLPENIADLENDPAVIGGKEPVVEGARFDWTQIKERIALALVSQKIAAEVQEMAAQVLGS